MEQKGKWQKVIFRGLSYVLVAVLASVITLALWGQRNTKLTQLENIIESMFIGEYDQAAIEDAAANAMVNALSDRWSFYMSAEEFAAYQETKNNAYVGVGITITLREDGTGFDIQGVTPGGSAQEAGILPGDVLVSVQGQSVAELNTTQVRELIGNEEGKAISVTVMRKGEELSYTLECRQIKVKVAEGEMLEGNIGYVRITNFNADCGEQTINVIEQLRQEGAVALIFDVRNNPGGYVDEMIEVLDHLLPEGDLFREVNYRGVEGTKHSDEACVELPMAVLVNGESYSAAEFFAACLREYEWATIVGEQTCGKGYYQNTIGLSDGSAVNLSTGKYFTPNGVSLTEAGGVTPDAVVTVDEETAALIYAQAIPLAEDVQVQAAVEAVRSSMG